ncbi:hypothetical protein GCM10023169_30330 [Georgenia halophila]|uniref:Uncharacterized protein n=1 Tax=Georgenia halophila TaxID=620889 RepID=A0ABP8LH57_9MICO
MPAARETVAGAFDAAAELPAAEADALRDAASAAFLSGLTTVSLVAAALLAVTGVVAGTVLRRHAS